MQQLPNEGWIPWAMRTVDEICAKFEKKALSAEAALIISVIAGQPVESGSMTYILHKLHDPIRSLADVAEETICTAMILCHGDRTLAARELHISRSTLYRRLLALPKADRAVH